jgi:glycosyltransferase involved in cell wall biosynthesis
MSAIPTASVVIPTRDRPRTLAACLESLAALEAPPGGFEAVVVDDGGRESLDGALDAVADRLDARLVRRARPAGPAAARNLGARRARGRVLAFTDDDCRVGPVWLAALVGAIDAAGGGVAAGGPTLAGHPANRWARASATVEAAVYVHENRGGAEARFLTPKNLAVPAADFAAVGGFDPTFRWSEDRDFCDRWREDGRGMAYVARAIVRHDRPLRARDFWRQHLEYGRGAHRYHRTRRARGRGGLRPDPRFYARLLALSASKPGSPGRRLGDTALVTAAQLATVAGYFAARRAGTPTSEGGSTFPSASASSRARLSASGRAAR